MPYTIKRAAEIMNVTPTTLRYYDKQGLLPFMERKESGYRVFSDTDIAMLKVIECLKKNGHVHQRHPPILQMGAYGR